MLDASDRLGIITEQPGLEGEGDAEGEAWALRAAGFRDMIILRTAGELVAAHIPQRKVQRALERLREQLPAGRSLSGVRISTDGERVIVRDGGAVWNPESGKVVRSGASRLSSVRTTS